MDVNGTRMHLLLGESDWLGPRAGHQHRVARADDPIAVGAAQLTEVVHERARLPHGRDEDAFEVVDLGRNHGSLGNHLQRPAGQPGHLDRVEDALLRGDPPDEHQLVVAVVGD